MVVGQGVCSMVTTYSGLCQRGSPDTSPLEILFCFFFRVGLLPGIPEGLEEGHGVNIEYGDFVESAKNLMVQSSYGHQHNGATSDAL